MITLDKKTKFDQIKDKLRELLLSGEFNSGDRFYSENRLSKMFGVARMTVNKVLTVLENEGLLQRIQGKGTFVSSKVSQLKPQEQMKIAMLTCFHPDHLGSSKYSATQFVNYIDNQAYDSHFKVNVFNLQFKEAIPDDIFNELCNGNYAGIIAAHLFLGTNTQNELKRLMDAVSIPIIFGDRYNSSMDSVEYDNEWIGWRGADYLMELGHSHIAFLGYQTVDTWLQQRITGFQKACKENKRSCTANDVILLSKIARNPQAVSELEKLFDDIVKNYSALMCANDELAKLVLETAKSRNIKIPEQLSIIGVDDNIDHRETNLTTFRLSGDELAAKSLDILMKNIKQPIQHAPVSNFIKPRLMERNTATIYNTLKD